MYDLESTKTYKNNTFFIIPPNIQNYYYMSNGLNLLHPRKDVAEMVIVFWISVCNKISQTCVSKVIVFCVTPIVPESFMIVSSNNVLV